VANWIFCRRCNPNLVAGIPGIRGQIGGPSGLPNMPNECPGCNVLFVALSFISEAVADQIVGAGNHHVAGVEWQTDLWVLFYDSGDYSRDSSRPVECTVTTITHPDDPTLDLITSISVAGGAFVWTRASNDPLDPDFSKFDLTTGTIDAPVCNCGPCVGVYVERHRVGFAWEDPVEDFTATVSMGNDPDSPYFENCNKDFTKPICLHYDATYPHGPNITDGWGFGGRWVYAKSYDGDDGSPCSEGATLTINGSLFDACEDQETAEFVAANITGCAIRLSWEGCDRDPREPPDESLFSIVLDDNCGGTLDLLTYGGHCEDGDDTDCVPDDCPAAYCRYQWNIDTQKWDLLDSTCIDPDVCPDPPPDPDVTDVAWVRCLCCEVTTPRCPEGKVECADGDCTWTWSSVLADWFPTDCSAIECACSFKPTTPGLLDGDVAPGICCKDP
jgi:hypothetical protein